MTIIKSIEDSFDGITMQVNNTNYHLRINGSKVTNIIYIYEVYELWKENLDARILSFTLKNIMTTQYNFGVQLIIVFEYSDKHVYCKLNNKILSDNEYTFINKEIMQEIKGGEYRTERDAKSFSKILP